MGFSAPHWQSNRPELDGLTSLRFFAAFEVVLGHAEYDFRFPDWLHDLASGSYQAVTFFFVLSGFVLVYAYVSEPGGKIRTSKARFWYSRFARVAPAFYVALGLIAPFIFYDGIWLRSLSPASSVAMAGATATFLPALFLPALTAWNPPSWSLAVEICLYAAFPFLIAPCFRCKIGTALGMAFAVVALSAATRLAALSLDPSETWNAFVYHCPLFYFGHFLVGVVTGRLFLFGPRLSARVLTMLFTLSAAALVGLTAMDFDWTYADILFAPLSAAMIFGATSAALSLTRWLALRPLVILGEASYALYILHWPLRLWWAELDRAGRPLAHMPALSCALYLATVVAVALLAYYSVERPARAYLLRLIRFRRSPI